MTRKKNSDNPPVINLGLSSLLEKEPELVPTQQGQLDPNFSKSLAWVENEWSRGFLPKALVLERAIELASGINILRAGSEPDESFKKLREVAERLAENLSSEARADFFSRFDASARTPKPITAIERPALAEPAPTTAPPMSEQPHTQWQKFERIMEAVSKQNNSEAKPAPVKAPRRFRSRSVSISSAVAAIILIVLYLSSSNTPARTQVSANSNFIHGKSRTRLQRITDDSLILPSLDAVDKVSSLASLVSEINAQPPVTPSVRARHVSGAQPQLAAMHSEEPADLQEKPAPKTQTKEALKIESSNEPEVVRAIQSEPEPSLKENTFDFPPYLNKKPVQASASSDVRFDSEGRAVVHFGATRRYSITAATQIMSRPSYWATRIGVFDPGEYVSVDAIIGVWLRTRDEYGNAGYILSQDAVPEMRASR